MFVESCFNSIDLCGLIFTLFFFSIYILGMFYLLEELQVNPKIVFLGDALKWWKTFENLFFIIIIISEKFTSVFQKSKKICFIFRVINFGPVFFHSSQEFVIFYMSQKSTCF